MRSFPDAQLDYDPFAADAMVDPYPTYRLLRQAGPIHRLPAYDAWAVPRMREVFDLGADDRFTIIDGPIVPPHELVPYEGPLPPPVPDPLPPFTRLDPPMHTRLRKIVAPSYGPRAVSRLEGRVRRLVRERLDELVPRGRFDVTTDYAGMVSAEVICWIAGLPDDWAVAVRQLVSRLSARDEGVPGMSPRGTAAYEELQRLLTEAVTARRAAGSHRTGALIDRLLAAEVDGRRLRDEEIARQLTVSGSETLPKVVARGVLELWRHPDQRAELVAEPQGCRAALEEMVRFGGPLQWVARTALRDCTVAGADVRAGQRILLLIASANRDEEEFDEPESFRWDRDIARHIGFGHGTHFCVGAHLARLEGRVLLEELLRRVPDYEIDEDGLVRAASDFQIGYTTVPLVVP